MGYATFKESAKQLTKAEDIGDGQIKLRHLSAPLFTEFRQLNLHTHSGVKSRRINIKYLIGSFPKTGFYMYSSDATKKYHVTINSNTGAFVLTEV